MYGTTYSALVIPELDFMRINRKMLVLHILDAIVLFRFLVNNNPIMTAHTTERRKVTSRISREQIAASGCKLRARNAQHAILDDRSTVYKR